MEGILLFSSFGVALIDWLAVFKSWRTVEYIAKPGMMILLLAWLYSASRFEGHAIWFALGLLFSLAGDVFLMLPKRLLIFGLISFLTAHIFYIVGFIYPGIPLSWTVFALAVILAVAAQQVYVRLAQALEENNRSLKYPVLAYIIVISTMLLAALLTLVRPEWKLTAAVFAAGGALLFYVSDLILSYHRFVKPLRHGRVKNLIPYHIGQLFITIAAVIQFAGL